MGLTRSVWRTLATDADVHQRAGGRRASNLLRQARAEARRAEVASRLRAFDGSVPHRFRSELAKELAVHRTTIGLDIALMLAKWRKGLEPPTHDYLKAAIRDVAAERYRMPEAQEREADWPRRELASRFNEGEDWRNRTAPGRTGMVNLASPRTPAKPHVGSRARPRGG